MLLPRLEFRWLVGLWLAPLLLAGVAQAALHGDTDDGWRLPGLPPTGPGPGRAPSWLLFVPDASVMTLDRGVVAGPGPTVLGRIFSSNVAAVAPGAGASAHKLLSGSELALLAGDEDWDLHHLETPGGSLDALGTRRALPPHFGDLLPQLVFSFEHDWGGARVDDQAEAEGAFDGSLVRLVRGPDGRGRVAVFLSELDVLKALDQPTLPEGDVDVNAFASDEHGNLFLSFRGDELVNGVLLRDDGIVCLPAEEIAFDAQGDVRWITRGCARIVADKPVVDGWVKAAGLRKVDGSKVNTLGDLSGLALDPAGGRFTPQEPIPGLPEGVPHLLFAGQQLGPTVLSTRDGGRVAMLDEALLGAVPGSGAPLGLGSTDEPMGGPGLAGLHVLPARAPRPLVDPVHLGLDVVYGSERFELALSGFTPGGWAWVMAGIQLPERGERTAAWPDPRGGLGPWLAVPPEHVGWWVPVDARGRAWLSLPVGGKLPFNLLALVQAFDGPTRKLSAPGATWFY